MNRFCRECRHFNKEVLVGYSYDEHALWQGYCDLETGSVNHCRTSLYVVCKLFEKVGK